MHNIILFTILAFTFAFAMRITAHPWGSMPSRVGDAITQDEDFHAELADEKPIHTTVLMAMQPAGTARVVNENLELK